MAASCACSAAGADGMVSAVLMAIAENRRRMLPHRGISRWITSLGDGSKAAIFRSRLGGPPGG